jgi:DnaK suppressor protein
MTLPEFTCLCPKTGQPDFATLELEYVPDELCVELKSLKLYIWSFRDQGAFHEAVTNKIADDLAGATSPRFLRLTGKFNVRGGIYTTVVVERRKRRNMPTKRAAAKPAKPKKVEKPKLTAKKPAAKTVAAKPSAKPAPAKTPAAAKPAAQTKPATKPAPATAAPAPASPAPATSVVQAVRKTPPPSDRIVVTATGVPSNHGNAAAMNRAASGSDDSDETIEAGSLLAGPRNVTPYITKRGEAYMNKEQLEHFRNILNGWKRDLMEEVDRTVSHMKDEAANFPDPNDRATQEEEFSLELRTRDRERKLIRKIDEALKRVEDGSYGYCLETGEEIGVKRLEARPVATLTIEAQERRERRERQYGDRDDRYR